MILELSSPQNQSRFKNTALQVVGKNLGTENRNEHGNRNEIQSLIELAAGLPVGTAAQLLQLTKTWLLLHDCIPKFISLV